MSKVVNPPDLLVSMEGGTGTSLLHCSNIKQRRRDSRMEEGGQYPQADLSSSTAMVIKVPGALQIVAVHWGWAGHPKCDHTCNSSNTDNRTCLHLLGRRHHSSFRKKLLIQSRWRPTQSAGSFCPPSKNVSCESPIQTEIFFFTVLPRVSRGKIPVLVSCDFSRLQVLGHRFSQRREVIACYSYHVNHMQI